MAQDARDLSEYFSFDKILLDSPCSGSGTISLDKEKTYEKFSEEYVNRLCKTQYTLLKKAIRLLKPGHELIYSTCSILHDENDKNIEKILKEEKVELVPINGEFLKDLPLLPVQFDETLCICPTEEYEGFFLAKLRKN